MKSTGKSMYYVIAVAIIILFGGCATGQSGTSDAGESAGRGAADLETVQDGRSNPALEDVIFHRTAGKDEVRLVFSVIPGDMNLTQPSERTLLLTSEDAELAMGAREHYRPGGDSTIRLVTVRSSGGGVGRGLEVSVALTDMVPYRITSTGSTVVLSFDSAVLGPAATPESTGPSDLRDASFLQAHLEREALKLREEEPPEFRGEPLSIVTQDAHIKNVFRLISEVSGYSIVSGPEVDQKVTLHMRNIPWDQALETILNVNSLGMTKRGRVITVMPLSRMEESEQQRRERDIAEGRVRQVSIEARIVEVTTTFARDIGIRWGYGMLDTWGGRDIGMLFGSSAPSDSTQVARFASGMGISGSNLAVNFPSGTSAVAPALGIIAGSQKFILNAKLEALEAAGNGRIISSPKVTTVENKTASIRQGEEIPYFSRAEAGATPRVEFKEAELSLAVTPVITAEGKLSMTIDAGNDYADWARAAELNLENPPIVTNRVTSTIVVEDGDTIVIGGIYMSTETSGGSGIPVLSRIPVLGWLFKQESDRKEQRELLIFVTPVILGVQAGRN